MGKEIASQVQETQRVPNRINPRQNTPGHILIKLTKIKHKEQILKEAREKTTNNTQEDFHKDNSWFINRNSSGQEGMAGHTQSDERKWPTVQITVPSKDLFQVWRRNQKVYRQAKAERFKHHQTSYPTNAKGSSLDREHKMGV